MKKLYCSTACLILLFSQASFSKVNIAKIEKLRGIVTVLSPGALHAHKAVRGDQLVADSSIVTKPRSFVKVLYNDGSTVNLGPKSKIILVEMQKDTGVGVISLLKGKIRASIKKRKSGQRKTKNKFFVKTRSAALGVRGTSFQITYNPENDATSLLTFEGKVAMVKVDDRIIEKQIQEVATDEERQVRDEQLQKIKDDWQSHKISAKNLDKILDANETVEVKPGQYAGVIEGLKKTSLPVKISPKQYTVLYYNKDFQKVRKGNVKTLLKQADQAAPLEGLNDKETGDFAPRAGGFLDANSGLYIPPKNTSKLNKKLQVYEAKSIGSVEESTGKYIAPVGLKLDAKQGFVLDKKYLAGEGQIDKANLLVMKESLNQTLATDVILKGSPIAPSIHALTYPELFQKDTLTYSFRPHDSVWHLNKVESSDVAAKSMEGHEQVIHKFEWHQVTDGNWQVSTSFSLKNSDQYKFDTDGFYNIYSDSHYGETLYGLGISLNYLMSIGSLLQFELSVDQDNYVAYYYDSSDMSYYLELEKIALLKVMASYQKRFLHFKRFFMDVNIGLGVAKSKEQGHFEIKPQFLSHLKLGFNYWLGRSYTLRLGLWTSYQTGKVEGAVVPATISREDGGAEFNMSFIF